MKKKATRLLLIIVCFLVFILSSSSFFYLWVITKTKEDNSVVSDQDIAESYNKDDTVQYENDEENNIDIYELTDPEEAIDNSEQVDSDSSSASIGSDGDELPDVPIE